MKDKKIILGIVDDHQIVIDGLKSLLHGHDQFDVVIECTQPLEMISLIEKRSIDILLTDVMMPGLNGAELSKLVHQQFPEIKILALSMSGQGDLATAVEEVKLRTRQYAKRQLTWLRGMPERRVVAADASDAVQQVVALAKQGRRRADQPR